MASTTEAEKARLERERVESGTPTSVTHLDLRGEEEEEEREEQVASPALIGCRIFFDAFLASLGAVGILLYSLFGAGILTKRGFHCSDESLAYPYYPSTIPSWVNGAIGVVVNVVIVVADRLVKAKATAKTTTTTLDAKAVGAEFLHMSPVILAFLAGCSLQHIFTDVAKYEVGKLRPHFMHVCQPEFKIDGQMVNCSSTKTPPYIYIENFTCTNTKYSESRQKEARISFPSGHCSFAFYAMTFAFIYVHFQLPKRFSSFLGVIPRPFLQFACLWWPWMVGISRYFDNKHHVSDILGGSIIGALVAVFFAIVLLRLHQQR